MSNEPVAWMHNIIEDNIIAHRPFDLDRHPDRWTPLYKNPTPCETCQALARTVMMDQTAHDTLPVDDTALLRQALEALETFQQISDFTPAQAVHAIIALRKRLGEKS
jgi:hypothetical protein